MAASGVRAQIVIRERVVVPATATAPANLLTDSAAVATVTVRRYAGGAGPAWTVGAPLAGPVRLRLTDGRTVTADLSNGVTPVPWAGGPPNEEFVHTLLPEVFHVALPPLVGIERLVVETEIGSDSLLSTIATQSLVWGQLHMGCNPSHYSYGTCLDTTTTTLKGLKIGLGAEVTATPVAAFVTTGADEIRCEATQTLHVTGRTASGALAWMDPRSPVSLRVPPTRGHLQGSPDGADGWLEVSALTALAGVRYITPPCAEVADTLTVDFRARYQGVEYGAATFRVLPRGGEGVPPPDPCWPEGCPPPDPCAPGMAARGTECPVARVHLLNQNDEEVSVGYVRVSKLRPDWLLPTYSELYDSAFAGTPRFDENGITEEPFDFHDPDTYRPQVSGVTSASPVEFRLEVFRNGFRAPIWVDGDEARDSEPYASYGSVSEQQANGTWTFRGSRFVRFVSNARPSEWSDTPHISAQCSGVQSSHPCYDDEIAGFQTVYVELGDVVRWTAALPTGQSVDRTYTVGDFGLLEMSQDVVRGVGVRWIYAGPLETPVNPIEATRRMNRYWAQAGIRFVPQEGITAGIVDHVVELDALDPEDRDHRASRAGTIRISILRSGHAPATALVGYDANRPIHDIATLVAQQLSNQGVLAQAVHHYETIRWEEGELVDRASFIVLFGLSEADNIIVARSEGLRAGRRIVDPNRLTQSGLGPATKESRQRALAIEIHLIGIRHGDGDISTIDYIVVPEALHTQGFFRQSAGAYAYPRALFETSMPTRVSTSVLTTSAATHSERPWTATTADPDRSWNGRAGSAAHEAGHLLLDNGIDGATTDDGGHVSDPTRLMGDRSLATHENSLTGPKRLTEAEQDDARRDGGYLLQLTFPPPLPAPLLPPSDGRSTATSGSVPPTHALSDAVQH